MDSLLSDWFGSAQLSASLIVPVVVVIVSAVLVFLCGIRKPKEPQFRKIAASVESSSKKTKRKEKQQSSSVKASTPNGNVKSSQSSSTAAADKKSTPAASKKDIQQQQAVPKRKEPVAPKKQPAPVPKKEKASRVEKVRKPADFDDSGWTTVQSRTDKKKKQEDLLLSNALDSALTQSKKSGGNKTDAKSTKNAKQLKDQVNKSKKEAAEINKKNKKNAANNTDNEQVNNKVVDTIENLVNELKKKDSNEIIAAARKQQTIDQAIDNAAEKSDDSKPVSSGGVIFDEMADTWTEAKAPKKGKKKARKE